MKKRLVLIIYFSLWFCALTFYNENALHLESSRVVGYGFAILQALMLSKLLLIPEEFLPFGVVFKPTVKGSLYLAIFIRTTIDSILVMALRYLIVGLEGLYKGNGFIESIFAFYQGDVKHVLAILCLYWLIVLPYVVYRFLVYLAGEKDLEAYLLERRAQT